MTFSVCDRCAVAIANDDYSAFEDDEWSSAEASVEAMGNVAPTGATVDGYGDCFVCDETVVDPAIWEAVA